MISVKPCENNTFSHTLKTLDKVTEKRKRILREGFTSKEEQWKLQMQKNCSFTHFQTMKNKHQKSPCSLWSGALLFFIFSILFEELLLSSIRSISYMWHNVGQWNALLCLQLDELALCVLNYLFKFKYMMGAIRKKARYKKIHLHDMRHTHATMLINQIS